MPQVRVQIWVAVEDPHVLTAQFELLLGVTVFPRVVGVGPEVRPAAHTCGAAALGVGHVEHAVRFGVQTRLVLFRIRNRITQAAGCRGGHHIDAVEIEIIVVKVDSGAKDTNEPLAHLEQLFQRTKPDHGDQWTVGVAHLVLGVRGQLYQRRWMAHALRLTWIVMVDPSARAAVVGTAVHVAGLRPTGEHDRTAGFEDGA